MVCRTSTVASGWATAGGDSGLTIDSTEGKGFTVKLKLRLGGM